MQKGGSDESTDAGGQVACAEQETEGKDEDASKDGDPRVMQPHPGEKFLPPPMRVVGRLGPGAAGRISLG